MKDINGKKLAGRLPRHGRNGRSLILREPGTDEPKDGDVLSTLEIAAKFGAEKVARQAERALAPAGSPQVKRSPEGESLAAGKAGAQRVWVGHGGGGRL